MARKVGPLSQELLNKIKIQVQSESRENPLLTDFSCRCRCPAAGAGGGGNAAGVYSNPPISYAEFETSGGLNVRKASFKIVCYEGDEQVAQKVSEELKKMLSLLAG
jgi:hypothetical protein